MNRGEMRAEVLDHLRATDGGAFDRARVDRALNRAARAIHTLVISDGGVFFARKAVTINPAGTKRAVITGSADLQTVDYVVNKSVCADSDFARVHIIPEMDADMDPYRGGYDPDGRACAYLEYDGTQADPWTLVFLTEQSGEFEVVYNRFCRVIAIENDPGDALIYDTIPLAHHDTVPLEAAVNLKGKNNEDEASMMLKSEHQNAIDALMTTLKRGTQGD